MAHEQRGGAIRRTERVVFTHQYVKREGCTVLHRLFTTSRGDLAMPQSNPVQARAGIDRAYSRHRQLQFSLVALLLLATACLVAQDRLPTIRVNVPLVSLDVAVLDSGGRPITNMTQDDFRIFDNGEQKEIKAFSSVETPYNVLALFDCTGSTREA